MIYPFKSFHFIGIGGIGMSALAQMLKVHGCHVQGSDQAPSSMTRHLETQGIRIHYGHAVQNIDGADCVIYSSSIQCENPELQEATRRGVMSLHRSEALVLLSQNHWVGAISGTHGKSTTTAMLGRILQLAGESPTVVVGAKIPDLGGNVCMGQGDTMILEADESDASFLAYSPNGALVTNIDEDHLDHFKDIDDILNHFELFLKRIDRNGFWVGCGDCPQVRRLAERVSLKAIYYGWGEGNQFRATQYTSLGFEGCEFEVSGPEGVLGSIRLKVIGRHNALNALGAIAFAMQQRIPFVVMQKALERFRGAERRFMLKWKQDSSILIDDYAHHPTEIQATLAAARNYTSEKVVAVFQPHRYSRTQKLFQRFVECFDMADEIVITDIYAAAETNPGFDVQALVQAIENRYDKPVHFVPRHHLQYVIELYLDSPGCVITMGAGNIGLIANAIEVARNKQIQPV